MLFRSASVSKGADVFAGTVRAAAPVKSGRLAGSIDSRKVDAAKYHVGPHGEPYFAVQESGAFIAPGHLMGPIEEGGYPRFIRTARVPGKHYVQAGFASGVGAATDIIEQSILSDAGLG